MVRNSSCFFESFSVFFWVFNWRASSMRALMFEPFARALFRNRVLFVLLRPVVFKNMIIFSSFERTTFAFSSALSCASTWICLKSSVAILRLKAFLFVFEIFKLSKNEANWFSSSLAASAWTTIFFLFPLPSCIWLRNFCSLLRSSCLTLATANSRAKSSLAGIGLVLFMGGNCGPWTRPVFK